MKLTGRGEKIFFSQWISFFLLLSVGFNKYSVTIAGFSLRLYMAALLFGTAFAISNNAGGFNGCGFNNSIT